MVADEKVDEHVGAELIEQPRVAPLLDATCDRVDVGVGGGDVGEWDVAAGQVADTGDLVIGAVD